MEKNEAETACKFEKVNDGSYGQKIDRLSQLPDKILQLILSFLSFKEVVRTSLVAHRWKDLWRYVPKLDLEDPIEMEVEKYNYKLLGRGRIPFIRWVNFVLEQHCGEDIEELRIAFDLDKRCQSDIDKWVDFATAKEVKRLELDFKPPLVLHWRDPVTKLPYLPPKYCYPGDFKSTLTSLCLNYVNVTTEVVERLLNSSHVLEILCIGYSELLTSVRASVSLPLKHLQVLRCPEMKAIDIAAPKLLSLSYRGLRIEFNIRNATSLSKLSIGAYRGVEVAYPFEPLSNYLSHLEYLHLQMHVIDGCNFFIEDPPALTNLKHLELTVDSSYDNTLIGWIPLIEACPALQTLTLKFCGHPCYSKAKSKAKGRPLNCLKSLKMVGYCGYRIDSELAFYVLENAVVLEEVIVDVHSIMNVRLPCEGSRTRAQELESKLSKGAKLIIK